MKLITPFTIFKNATSDIWKMHDFNYQLPKDLSQDYWDNECISHPTSSHCKIYNWIVAFYETKYPIYFLKSKIKSKGFHQRRNEE